MVGFLSTTKNRWINGREEHKINTNNSIIKNKGVKPFLNNSKIDYNDILIIKNGSHSLLLTPIISCPLYSLFSSYQSYLAG